MGYSLQATYASNMPQNLFLNIHCDFGANGDFCLGLKSQSVQATLLSQNTNVTQGGRGLK